MSRLNKAAALVIGAVSFAVWVGPAAARNVTPDDTARFLAGMRPSADSPLAPLTRNPTWQQHAKSFDTAWDALEKRQLSKIRIWSARHLKDPKSPLFYMFSGPDFLYANAFFPAASTYVMSGLEPVGVVPAVSERSIRSLSRIQSSIASSLQLSFFITKKMREQLQGGELAGTLPILYVYIARAGKTIREVSLVTLDKDGEIHPVGQFPAVKGDQGVKIVFAGSDGAQQTLYYFRTDLSDSGVKNSGFLRFSDKLGTGHGLLKSASYLMHSGGFSQVRDFVLKHSKSVVQDDSGIPLKSFKADEWQFKPFGKYMDPIAIFPGKAQAALRDLYKKGNPPPLEFGIGYRHRVHDSNLLLAVKKETKVPVAAPAPAATPAPTPAATTSPAQSPAPTAAPSAPKLRGSAVAVPPAQLQEAAAAPQPAAASQPVQ